MGSLRRSQQLIATCYARHLSRLASGTSRPTPVSIRGRWLRRDQFPRGFFSFRNQQHRETGAGKGPLVIAPVVLLSFGGLLIYSLYPDEELRQARLVRCQAKKESRSTDAKDGCQPQTEQTAWSSFANRFEQFSNVTDIEWAKFSDRIVDWIVPEWSKALPGQIRKLQHELSMSDGSLASEIWQEAHDPFIHPEIQYSAKVRVSDELCDEEKEYLARRRKVATAALAKYLGINEKDINPEDVPTIAMCGSGGGLRALVAGTGSLLATQEDGLFDCVTYTSGVSGSCWLQSLYHSSLTNCRFERIVDHLKARIGVHIAYPPAAFTSVTSSPTNKLLLSSLVEKLRGDPKADFGLVDVYGILLAARLLVPKGELGINERDFKLSNQREYIKYGQNPMPIYTAVRHEIPDVTDKASNTSLASQQRAKEIAKQEAWFQWFELTPYEFFCEEFNAGIPTWALGRRFRDGEDVPPEGNDFHLPELRMPIMMGIFGSAFCATLSHYYREIRPLVKSLTGFSTIDEMIYGYNEDLEKVHPIDPAQIPNFTYNMQGKLRFTTPTTIYDNEYIQLMDAGMSNNLPIYPLLRPGRDVDIIVAFDASADVKTDNWLSVADGYARQRGVKGWPIGVGWPKSTDSTQKIEHQLDAAQADSAEDANTKVKQAQQDQDKHDQSKSPKSAREQSAEQKEKAKHDMAHPEDSDLGYCTIWVGKTEERSSEPPPPTKALTDDSLAWQLTEPSAGITVAYLPLLANPKVEGANPATSDYMSTWNFVYTPEQVDKVVALARANFAEGKDRIRRCVRAVYERKKKVREDRENAVKKETYRRLVRLGIADKLGEGDHFS
ncbi:FabD/lysophospholipase-like protein [Hypomontagnella monticulosa]|nr:FabD/lysophospholipase-like protein [Hypomontagnella monticulosa]